jgi:hypothetical protein
MSRPSRPAQRDVSRTSRTLGAGCGGRGDVRRASARGRMTHHGRRSRVVLTPRRWRQVGGAIRWRWWQTSPVIRESTEETVKTIARGMPDVFRCDRGDYPACLLPFTRDCGRIERPAFPAPSLEGRPAPSEIQKAARAKKNSRRSCGEIAKVCPSPVIIREGG